MYKLDSILLYAITHSEKQTPITHSGQGYFPYPFRAQSSRVRFIACRQSIVYQHVRDTHACMHTYIHIYIYINTYSYAYIHTYSHA